MWCSGRPAAFSRLYISRPRVRSLSKVLTMKSINAFVPKVEYAVRGPVLQLADQITQDLEQGSNKYPFKNVVKVNIGDAQAAGQPYLTFYRQVLSCVAYPPMMEEPDIPEDVKRRATRILEACTESSSGCYCPSLGLDVVREDVATYMESRDGHPSRAEDIIITMGASAGIRFCFQMLRDMDRMLEKPVGIMTPVPLYPIFSALLSEYNLTPVDYFLDENHQWTVGLEELERAHREAIHECNVRAIVLINPGNPTGQVFSAEILKDIIKFAHKHGLLIIADEVYQDNIFDDNIQFHSVKKCMEELGPPYRGVRCATLLTISKGYSGEAGARTGWMEVLNLPPAQMSQLQHIVDSHISPSTLGQAMVEAAVAPPEAGEPSHSTFMKERNDVLKSQKERAEFLVKELNTIPGYKCNPIQGALYAFPQISLPSKAIEEARKLQRNPDEHYAFKLLHGHGICVVPGSGFGQKPDTHHYRISVLPTMEVLQDAVQKIKQFHQQFLKEYS